MTLSIRALYWRDAPPPLEASPQQQLDRTSTGTSRKFAILAVIGTTLLLPSIIPFCFTFSSVYSWHMLLILLLLMNNRDLAIKQ